MELSPLLYVAAAIVCIIGVIYAIRKMSRTGKGESEYERMQSGVKEARQKGRDKMRRHRL